MRPSRERVLLLALLAVVAVVWWLALGDLNQGLAITAFDVGQGDSILIQTPSGRTVLIDGGGLPGQSARGYDIGREVVVPGLLARRVRKIDVLVITHPDEDHIGGLPAVIDAIPVGLVLDPMLPCESASYERVREAIERRGVKVHRATEGQRLNLGDGIQVEVLNPPDPRLRETGSDDNNNSVVLRLTYGGLSALLTGDIDRVGAARMGRLGEDLRSTFLKVPHHGSAGAADRRFVEAVRPELAIISVGENNRFGHPSEEMLRELRRVGAKVMRTDEEGAITVKFRPPDWSARGYVGFRPGRKLSGRASAIMAGEAK